MRVANIIEEGKLGGPQVRIVRVAVAMSEVDTLVIMPSKNSGRFRELCESNGVPYKVLPISRITKECSAALAYILFSPFEILNLVYVLKKQGVDLVHASGGSWQYKGVLAARIVGIPSVWHLNDTSMPRWVKWMFNVISPLASGFIYASHRSRNYYGGKAAISTRPEAIVTSTVDVSFFDREKFPLKKPIDPLRVGCLANVSPVKGLETFIRAAGRLQEEFVGLEVSIAGAQFPNKEKYIKQLKELAHGVGASIDWVGSVSDVRGFLASLDVYVCSSNAESSPVSVWEAMSMSCPVVSTNVGDVSRHIADGVSGFVVPVKDHNEIATKVGLLLADSDLRDSMGQQARQASHVFSPSSVAEKTHNLYRTVSKNYGNSVG